MFSPGPVNIAEYIYMLYVHALLYYAYLYQLKLHRKLVEMLEGSSRVGANVVKNLRTVTVHHVLHGLLPQLGGTPSSGPTALSGPGDRHESGAGLSKVVGHIKFNVPLVDWTHQALEDLRMLCEELASEGNEDDHVCSVHPACACYECIFVCCIPYTRKCRWE